MNEKRRQKQAEEEAYKKIQAQRMQQDARMAQSRITEQRKKWYEKYKRDAEAKRYKDANFALNMFRLMQKLCLLCDKYIALFETQQAITEMFTMLKNTNKSFATVMKIASGGEMRKIKRNLKKFKKGISKFERYAEDIINVIDSLFDENKGKKGKKGAAPEKSDEELFFENLSKNQDLVSIYEEQNGASGGLNGLPTGGSAPVSGSSVGSVGDDDYPVVGGIGSPTDN